MVDILQLNARKYRCRIGKMTKSYPRRIYSAIRNFWQTLRAKCELPTDFRFGFAYNQIFKMSVWDISAEVAHRAIDKSGPILEAIYAFTRLPLLLCGRDSSEYLGIPFSTKMHLLAGCRNEGQKKSSVKQKTHLCAVQKVQRRKSTSLTKHSYESLEKLITQKNCSGLAFTTRDDPVSSAAALNQLVVNM
ncbi:hypothetical protein BC830DRAFT_1094824 [Chytriomyces sp. MP71]|nr:hypothetical protein BC830DRAFT_1094824 [Chytriomyces sp. MP71]